MVFERDAAGNRASLTFHCMASGNPPPNITWYRGSTRLPNNLVNASTGSLHIVNITENTDATRAGLLYHCTANNTFGMIRSRAANVSYACELKEGKRGSSSLTSYTLCRERKGLVTLQPSSYCHDRNSMQDPHSSHSLSWIAITSQCVYWISASHYLTAMFDNCVPQ